MSVYSVHRNIEYRALTEVSVLPDKYHIKQEGSSMTETLVCESEELDSNAGAQLFNTASKSVIASSWVSLSLPIPWVSVSPFLNLSLSTYKKNILKRTSAFYKIVPTLNILWF